MSSLHERRRPLGWRRGAAVLGALLVVTMAACGSDSDADSASKDDSGLSGKIVWADYGGTTDAALKKTYFDDFTKETGVEVVSTTLAAGIQNGMFDGKAGDYDASMTGMAELELYKDNILELPASVKRNDTLPADAQDKAFGTMIIGYAQAYLTETFPDGGPQTWADFWDTKKYPGKRAVPGEYHDFMIEAALMADGVTADELYPLDLDRAFKKLAELKDDMVFYTEYPQVQQLLSSGAASVAFAPNGLFAGLQNEGVDTTVSWNQAFLEANIFVVAAKAPNRKNVFALADFMADPVRQAAFAKVTNYGPGNAEAFDHMDDGLVASLPNSPSHTEVVTADAQARADVYDEAAERYTAFLAGE